MECLYAEVEELLPLLCIGELEVDSRVTIFPMAHISGKDGQGGLGVLFPGPDAV